MRRPIQDPRTGTFTYAEAAPPSLAPGGAVIRVGGCLLHASVSLPAAQAGDASPSSSTALVRAETTKPGLVRRVWSSFRQAGVKKAYETFVSRKTTLRSIEYGGVGVITAVAPRSGFRVGQRVAWAGYGLDLPAPLVFVAAARLVALPETLSEDAALLALPGGMAWRAVEAAELRLGLPVGVGGQNLAGCLARGLCRLAGATLYDLDLTHQPSERPSAERLAALIVTDAAAAERLASGLSGVVLPQARLVAGLPELPAAVWAVCRAHEMQVRFTWTGGGGARDPFEAAVSPTAAMAAFGRFAADLPAAALPTVERRDFDAVADAVADAFRPGAPPNRAVAVVYPSGTEAGPPLRFDVGKARPKLAGTVGLAIVADADDDGLRDFVPAKQVRLTGVVATEPETAKRLVRNLNGEYGANDVSPLLSDGKTDVVLMGRAADALRFAGDVLRGRLPLFLTTLPTQDEDELEALFRLAATHDTPLVLGFARLSTPAFADLQNLRPKPKPAWLRYDFQEVQPIHSAAAVFRLAEAIRLATALTDGVPERLYAQEVGGESFTALALTLALSDGSSVQIGATFGAKSARERLSVHTADGWVEREDLAPTAAVRRACLESFLKVLADGESFETARVQSQQAVRTALRIRDSLDFGTVVGLSSAI